MYLMVNMDSVCVAADVSQHKKEVERKVRQLYCAKRKLSYHRGVKQSNQATIKK